jgi:hypothetical protein
VETFAGAVHPSDGLGFVAVGEDACRVEVVDAVLLTGLFDGLAVELAVHHHEVDVDHLGRVSQEPLDDLVLRLPTHARDDIKNKRDISTDDFEHRPLVVSMRTPVAEDVVLVALDIAGEPEAFGRVDGRHDRPTEFAVLTGASNEHPRRVANHRADFRNGELADLVAVGRSRRYFLAGRIERERRRAAASVHVLAHPHVGVLLPESVLVNLPVLATAEREPIADERFGLLPHLVGLLSDELVFGTVVGLRLVRFAGGDPFGERDIAIPI